MRFSVVLLLGLLGVFGLSGARCESDPLLGGCAVTFAEHPTLTNVWGNVVVCGTGYGRDRMTQACGEDWHVCGMEEFESNYPASGCNPYGYWASFGSWQHKRCGGCTQPKFLGLAPVDEDPQCFNSLNVETGVVSPILQHPFADGKIIMNRNGTEETYLFSPWNEWVNEWAIIPEDSKYFGVFCCSETNFNATAGCAVKEAEHPSFTTLSKDGVLCGGSYSIEESYRACGEHWHICSEAEYSDRFGPGEFPSNESSFGDDQRARGVACPYRENDMWIADAPAPNARFFCGDVCDKPKLAGGHGVALQNETLGAPVIAPRVMVEANWIRMEDFVPLTEDYEGFSVLCCKKGLAKDTGMPDCPAPPDESSSVANKPPMPLWGVLVTAFAIIGLIFIMIALVAFTVAKQQIQNAMGRRRASGENPQQPLMDEAGPEDAWLERDE